MLLYELMTKPLYGECKFAAVEYDTWLHRMMGANIVKMLKMEMQGISGI